MEVNFYPKTPVFSSAQSKNPCISPPKVKLIAFSQTHVHITTQNKSRSVKISALETQSMVKAIRVHELGDPEVMKWEDVEIGEPKEGEIKVKNKAIGVNFIDVYFRKGVYEAKLPFIPGMEAVGVVTAVGPGLTGREVGDIVAYARTILGSYSEEQILPANVVVPVPSSIDYRTAASVMLKGMTAHMLVRRCFKVEPGHTVLVHAAAGGVGSLLCQWANVLGATVIGTVSNEEKAAQAAEDGCHHVIMYTKEDFVSEVNKITSGKGVNVVYDSVGKDTYKVEPNARSFRTITDSEEVIMYSAFHSHFEEAISKLEPERSNHHAGDLTVASMLQLVMLYQDKKKLTNIVNCIGFKDLLTEGRTNWLGFFHVEPFEYPFCGSISCLASKGYMVSFGQSSGKPDPIPLSDLAPKSLFLTRPSLFHYVGTRDELLEAAGELFANVASGVLRVRINHTYPLSQAAKCHADLEARKTSGSILLIPDDELHS